MLIRDLELLEIRIYITEKKMRESCRGIMKIE